MMKLAGVTANMKEGRFEWCGHCGKTSFQRYRERVSGGKLERRRVDDIEKGVRKWMERYTKCNSPLLVGIWVEEQEIECIKLVHGWD